MDVAISTTVYILPEPRKDIKKYYEMLYLKLLIT